MPILRTTTIAALLALSAAAPAFAADPGAVTTSIRVPRLADASPAADRRMERRIADAALEACGASPFSAAEVKAAVARSRCWHESYADGMAQLDPRAARTDVASLPPTRTMGKP